MVSDGVRIQNADLLSAVSMLFGTKNVGALQSDGRVPVDALALQMLGQGPFAALVATGAFKPFATFASMTLAYAADTIGWVYADATLANNGIYRKLLGSGSGSWSKILPLPYSFARAAYTGGGTVNAIVAESDVAISERMLVALDVAGPDTVSPVTVAFNGGAALTIKTASGDDVPAGALVSGLGVVSGSTFRLLSDLSSSGLQAAVTATQLQRKTASYQAVSGNQLICDTTGGAFTVTLPAAPAAGANVRLIGNGWDVHNLTVARNGQTIDGAASNLICDYDADILLIFLGGTWTY